MSLDKFKLCYVDEPWAYFTTCPLDKQWGDDWNDAPYEHNAGAPYEWHESDLKRGVERYEILRIAYSSQDFETPAGHSSNRQEHVSVEQINSGAVAWLHTPWLKEGKVSIQAGTSLPEFIKLMRGHGQIYLPIGMVI